MEGAVTRLRPGAETAARELAVLARTAVAVTPGTPRRRLWRVAAAVAAAVVLSGAGTVTAYQLSIPPFQGLPQGIARIRPSIVVEYDGVDRLRHRCQVFPEFKNLSHAQERTARDWARRQDWTGYGDRLTRAVEASTAEDQEKRILAAVDRDVRRRFAEQMVPGVILDPRRRRAACHPGTMSRRRYVRKPTKPSKTARPLMVSRGVASTSTLGTSGVCAIGDRSIAHEGRSSNVPRKSTKATQMTSTQLTVAHRGRSP